MKKFLLAIIFLGMFSICFADVTATIIGKDIDSNGNIIIKTQYKIDGVEVPSNYPSENGKYFWVTRYSLQNFAGMTKLQIAQRIAKDLRAFADRLIQQKYMSVANPALINGVNFDNIINQTVTENSYSIYVDTDGDNVADTEWQVYTNGTRVDKPYTP